MFFVIIIRLILSIGSFWTCLVNDTSNETHTLTVSLLIVSQNADTFAIIIFFCLKFEEFYWSPAQVKIEKKSTV